MLNFWVDSEQAPTFLEWLSKSRKTCPQEIYKQAVETGRYGDYDNWMEYLRRRYRMEMDFRRDLIDNNPFAQKKEEKNYGYDVSGNRNDEQGEDSRAARGAL